MANKLKAQANLVYKIAFDAGLALCGAERNGEPMFIGTAKQFTNFNSGIIQSLNKTADSLS